MHDSLFILLYLSFGFGEGGGGGGGGFSSGKKNNHQPHESGKGKKSEHHFKLPMQTISCGPLYFKESMEWQQVTEVVN